MGHVGGMEKVIEAFIEEANKANDYKLIIGYQWALNASESSGIDVLDAFMAEKAKGF